MPISTKKLKSVVPNIPLPRKPRLKKTGLPPGAIIFTGEKLTDEVTLTHTIYAPDYLTTDSFLSAEIPPRDNERTNWYDVRGLHDTDLIQRFGELFDIHPLILEDIVDVDQRPKFEEYDNGFVVVIRALHFDTATRQITPEQVTIYVSEQLVMTFQEDARDLFVNLRERLANQRGRIKQRGADYLAYAVMDTIVDRYFVILDEIEQIIEQLELQVVQNPTQAVRSEIHTLKIAALSLRKSIAPLREAVGRFSKSEHALVQEGTLIFLRDLYDHTIQVLDMVETYRDMLNGLHDLYLSEVSYKMNSVMQLLTVISTIFIPLTFLSGLYGMNFEYMPELSWRYSYPVLWLVMLTVAGGLLYYFKRKGWYRM